MVEHSVHDKQVDVVLEEARLRAGVWEVMTLLGGSVEVFRALDTAGGVDVDTVDALLDSMESLMEDLSELRERLALLSD